MAHEAYLEPYLRSLAEHGPRFESTLWISRKSQRIRFEVFAAMYAFAGKRVADAGCGRGDFAAFLLKRAVAFQWYVGVDAMAPMVQRARARGLPRCEFVHGDFILRPDLLRSGEPQVVCISGALNTMSDEQMTGVLGAAWRAASDAVLFNFLPLRPGRDAAQAGPARRVDPLKLLDWARQQTTQVTFRQDYFAHGHDATIGMFKS